MEENHFFPIIFMSPIYKKDFKSTYSPAVSHLEMNCHLFAGSVTGLDNNSLRHYPQSFAATGKVCIVQIALKTMGKMLAQYSCYIGYIASFVTCHSKNKKPGNMILLNNDDNFLYIRYKNVLCYSLSGVSNTHFTVNLQTLYLNNSDKYLCTLL